MKVSYKIISRFRSAMSLGLILWCAGAGCMLVTYARAAAMSGDESQKNPLAGLTAAGGHDCCKARHSSKRTATIAKHNQAPIGDLNEFTIPESSNPTNAMSCCPLTSGSFVVNTRQTPRDDTSVITKRNTLVVELADAHENACTNQLYLPNHGQSYLLGCSFLI